MKQSWKDLLQTIDRVTNYQSWFIPLIWLYWPTKARKRENRRRRKSVAILHSQSSFIGSSKEGINATADSDA